MSNILALMTERKAQIARAVPPSFAASLTIERILQTVDIQVRKNPALAKCSPESVYAAVLEIVGRGLDLGLDGQAYLVPYSGQCTALIGARGKIELAYRGGKISKIIVQAVYEHDEGFEIDQASGFVKHTIGRDYLIKMAKADPGHGNPRGEVLAAYARIWIKGEPGDPIPELMTAWEFGKIVAEAKRKGNGRLSPAYANWPDEMLRRSCLNRALKRVPCGRDLLEVLTREIEVEFGEDADVRTVGKVAALPDMGTLQPDPEPARSPALVVVRDVIDAPMPADPALHEVRAEIRPEPDVDGRTAADEPGLVSEVNALQQRIGNPGVSNARRAHGIGPGPLRLDLSLTKLTAYAVALRAV